MRHLFHFSFSFSSLFFIFFFFKQITIIYNDNWMGLRFRFQLGPIWHSKSTNYRNTLVERRSNMVQFTVFQRTCICRYLGNGGHVWILCLYNCKKDLLGKIIAKQAKQINRHGIALYISLFIESIIYQGLTSLEILYKATKTHSIEIHMLNNIFM